MAAIFDHFDRADADGLGSSAEGWSWTEVLGDIDIVSQVAHGQVSGGHNSARAEINLDSSDHYAQFLMVDFGASGVGPCVRYDPASDSYYVFFNDGTDSRLFRVAAGGFSFLATSGIGPAGNGTTVKIQAEGAVNPVITCYIDGVEAINFTDTGDPGGLAGNLRTGMVVDVAGRANDFLASDLEGRAFFLLTRF